MTPVHYVALRGQNMRNKNFYKIYERILENLVNFGARFDIPAKDGSLPLLIAKKSDDAELVALFHRQMS